MCRKIFRNRTAPQLCLPTTLLVGTCSDDLHDLKSTLLENDALYPGLIKIIFFCVKKL